MWDIGASSLFTVLILVGIYGGNFRHLPAATMIKEARLFRRGSAQRPSLIQKTEISCFCRAFMEGRVLVQKTATWRMVEK